MALDCMNAESPLVSQGSLATFRARLIRAGLDSRLGRKSKSKRFNGYKQHVATDLDTALILACAATPANRPEQEATPQLQADLRNQGAKFEQLYIDRGYINSTLVDDAQAFGAEVICKPWQIRGGKPHLFKKTDFKLDMRSRIITCPSGQTEPFEPGHVAEFDPDICGSCLLRAQCTHSANGKGRTVSRGTDVIGAAPLRGI
jgi:hypothetical protein